MRIGLCDDSPGDQAAALEVLEKLGLQADVFGTGEALQAAFWKQPYDLVLLDIEMPGMNGIETFRRMQRFPVKVPVIFLTASGDEEDVMNAIKLGAANYLKKPFFPQELLKRVAKELGRQ